MAKWVSEIIPDPKILLALEPEEIAPIVLEFLNSLSQDERGYLNRYAFGLHGGRGYAHEYQQRVACALMEGWMWLEREGLIAPNPEQHGDWVFITRRGQQMKSRANLEAYRRANVLPRQLLHPVLAAKIVAPFTRGDYDTAVFQAFKEVEVAVRTKAKLPPTDIGVTLIRKAFDPNAGPLRDANAPPGEPGRSGESLRRRHRLREESAQPPERPDHGASGGGETHPHGEPSSADRGRANAGPVECVRAGRPRSGWVALPSLLPISFT